MLSPQNVRKLLFQKVKSFQHVLLVKHISLNHSRTLPPQQQPPFCKHPQRLSSRVFCEMRVTHLLQCSFLSSVRRLGTSRAKIVSLFSFSHVRTGGPPHVNCTPFHCKAAVSSLRTKRSMLLYGGSSSKPSFVMKLISSQFCWKKTLCFKVYWKLKCKRLGHEHFHFID